MLIGIDTLKGHDNPYRYTAFAIRPDFPFNNINFALTDSEGFIWLFEMQGGIYRFDGHEALPGQRIFGDSIPTHLVRLAAIDDRDFLWWCDDQQISIADLSAQSVKTHPLPFANDARAIGVSGIYVGDGMCYVGSDHGQLYRIQSDGSTELIADISNYGQGSLFQPAISNITEWEGMLYFNVSRRGVFRYVPNKGVEQVDLRVLAEGDNSRCTWLGRTDSSLFVSGRFDGFIRIRPDSVIRVYVADIPADESKHFFPVGESQVVQFLPDETQLWRVTGNRLVPQETIREHNAHFMPMYDKSGIFFKNQRGLYRLSPNGEQLFQKDDIFRLINAGRLSIRHIFEHGGDIHVGTYHTLFQLGKGMREDRRRLEHVVRSSAADGHGNTWLGLEGNGLSVINASGHIRSVLGDENRMNQHISTLCFVDAENLFIGTYEGGYTYNTRSHRLRRLAASGDTLGVHLSRINKIRRAGDRVYIATDKGFYWTEDTDTLRLKQLPEFPGTNPVYDFQQEGDVLWLATRGLGVVKYDLKADALTVLDSSDGLAGNTVFCLLAVNGRLVCGTNSGLSIIGPDGKTVRNFHVRDGLPEEEFNMGTMWTDGRIIYMGTTAGAIAFTLADVEAYNYRVDNQRFISFATISNRTTSAYREEFALPHKPIRMLDLGADERLVVLNFRAMDAAKSTARYYRLEPQQAWLPVNGNSLMLSGLSPGTNTVSFSTDGKVVADKLVVRVGYYYHETWWFKLVLAGCMVLLVWGYIRYRIGRGKKEMALRARISSDLHDEVGGVLTGISMQADYLVYNNGLPDDGTSELLEQIATAGRKAAIAMNDVVWSVDSRNDDWGSLLGRMRLWAGSLCEASGVRLQFESHGIGHDSNVAPNIRQDLYLIYKETVNNCCKHAGATVFHSIITLRGQELLLQMTDDGKGMEEEQGHGQGLRNMRMRAQRINAHISFSTPESGTGLQITMRLNLSKTTPKGRKMNR